MIGASLCTLAFQPALAEGMTKHVFNVPPMAVADALKMVSEQSEHPLLYSPEIVGSIKTDGFVCKCTVDEMLAQILKGHDLEVRRTEYDVILIRRSIPPSEHGVGNVTKNQKQALLAGAAAAAITLGNQQASAQDTIATAQETAAVVEENKAVQEVIVVTGIRASLQKATDLKRSSNIIQDSIVAEDIGKLPDNNIAEALQRITGVSINTDFGIGDSVSIRGLSENRVELNGRSTVGDDRDGISLQDFPSSFLKTVEVVKSPTADMIEGALGGTVRMSTIRPTELDGLTIAGSLDAEYADKTEEIAPIANLSLGNVWEVGNSGAEFGVIASFAYQNRTLRQDEFFNRVEINNDTDTGLTSVLPSGYFVDRDQNTVQQFVEERERTAANLTLEYSPSDRGSFYFDFAMTERDGHQEGSSILDDGGSNSYHSSTTQDANGQLSNYSLTDAYVLPKSWSQFRATESESFALGGDWDFTDDFNLSGEISIAKSDSVEPRAQFNMRSVNRDNWIAWADAGGTDYDADRVANGLRHEQDVFISQDGEKLPSLIYSDNYSLISPENLAVRAFEYELSETSNEETAFRLDADYANPFGVDFISAVKAGVRFSKNDYSFNKYAYAAKDLYKRAFYEDGSPQIVFMDEFEAMFPDTFHTINFENSFDQTGLSGQNDLLEYRIFRGDLLADADYTFDLFQQMLAGTNFATTGSLQDNLSVNEDAFRDISEETSGFYAMADLSFGALRANVGGRYIKTDLSSTVYVGGDLVTGQNDYTDFLPSLNMSYDLTDNTVIRFAAAKVMRRPNYDQLSPAFEVNTNLTEATSGAIDLDPFRATQFDVSVEHYFGEGGLLSGAIFYKDVESFLSNKVSCYADSRTATEQVTSEFTTLCLLDTAGVSNDSVVTSTDEAFVLGEVAAGRTGIRLTEVTNGENGTVQGFEFGYQQQFTFLPGFWSGFGINANYTYADSEQPNGNALLDISKNTINTQLYWENEQFQARLAYNFRDSFLDEENFKRVQTIGADAEGAFNAAGADPTEGNSYRDDRGQLDASASWNVNDHITFVASATNLTGEPSLFVTELGSPWMYREADRRFSFGIRAKY